MSIEYLTIKSNYENTKQLFIEVIKKEIIKYEDYKQFTNYFKLKYDLHVVVTNKKIICSFRAISKIKPDIEEILSKTRKFKIDWFDYRNELDSEDVNAVYIPIN